MAIATDPLTPEGGTESCSGEESSERESCAVQSHQWCSPVSGQFGEGSDGRPSPFTQRVKSELCAAQCATVKSAPGLGDAAEARPMRTRRVLIVHMRGELISDPN